MSELIKLANRKIREEIIDDEGNLFIEFPYVEGMKSFQFDKDYNLIFKEAKCNKWKTTYLVFFELHGRSEQEFQSEYHKLLDELKEFRTVWQFILEDLTFLPEPEGCFAKISLLGF